MKNNTIRLLLAMSKYTCFGFIIQICFFTFVLAKEGNAQKAKNVRDVELEIEFVDEKIENVFSQLERLSDFEFIYHEKDLKQKGRFSLNKQKIAISDLLLKLSEDQALAFKQVNKNITVKDVGENNNLKKESRLVFAADVDISGKITDENGMGLPGASVVENGTTNGTTSDLDGNYRLSVTKDAIITISFVGYVSKEINVSSQSIIDIQMELDASQLKEVVIVGYSTQKKANMTGSVSTVSSDVLLKRPTTNATNLLQGRIPGLEINQTSGQPGRDGAVLKIRGLGSFGASSAPLILIDGVVGSLANLSPNDIESITVLKDAASASVYGARASNGVVLVNTKQAKKGTSFEYQLDVGVHSATRLPKMITNSVEYMEMYNSARARAGQPPLYTLDQIDSYRNATDLDQYPNFDWVDYYINPASATNHYLSFSNAGEKNSFKVSLSYLDQDGIMPNINFKRYNAQLNFSSQLTERIKVGTNMSLMYTDNVEPWINPGSSAAIGHGAIYQNAPLYKPFLPDGSGRKTAWAYPNEPHDTRAPAIFDDVVNRRNNYVLNSQVFLDIDLIKGLKWSTKAALSYSLGKSKLRISETHERYFYHKLPGETDYSLHPNVTFGPELTDRYDLGLVPTLSSVLNYEKQLDDHNLRAMAGFEQVSSSSQYIRGTRSVFPTNSLSELDAGSTESQSLGGSTNEWAIRGYFGRLAYDYNDKYLVEVNARYDGTSRVAEATRWGFFPSVSAGWRISEESFIQDNLSWINNLKLRASYGVLGNQDIGNYPYQDLLDLSSYPLNGAVQQTAVISRLSDKNLKWESTKIIDFGLDLEIKNGLFGITFDWFKKNTFDILTRVPVPGSLGLSGPIANNGELQNTGFELELRHANKIGDVTYDANFMVSTYKNKLISIVTPTKGRNEVGLPYNSFYLYEMEGIFQSQNDIDNSADHIFNNPIPGDIKIKDQNGDNIIDQDDRISIAPYPTFTYSFGFNIGWKGFNLSSFFQGVQGSRVRLQGWGFDPFLSAGAPVARFKDAWSPTNPSNTIPAVYDGWSYGGVHGYPNTWSLPSSSYLRVKNVSLSYTLPKELVEKIKLQGVTIFVSGDNLITWTKFPGMDPEITDMGNGSNTEVHAGAYPQVRIWNTGVRIKF